MSRSIPASMSVNLPKISRNDFEKSGKNTIFQKNIIRMVIFSSFMNILTQMPFSFCYILGFSGVNSSTFNLINSLTIFLVILAPGCDLFLYYAV